MLVHQNAVVKITEDMPLDRAALIGCGVTTGMGAVFRTAKVEPGSRVCVIGAGGIGLAAIQAARIAGAGQVIVVDVSDDKLETARQLGGTDPSNATPVDDVVEAVKELSGGGVDYSFEAIGRKETAEQAFNMLDLGGTATVIGMVPVEADARDPGHRPAVGEAAPGLDDGLEPVPDRHAGHGQDVPRRPAHARRDGVGDARASTRSTTATT